MAQSDGFRKYLEAGAVLGHVTRARAEEIVRELVNAGEVQRGQSQQWVDDLVERSRKATESLVHLVRTEVASQLESLGLDSESLAKQVSELLKQSAGAGRKATSGAAGTAGATVGRTASAAKKAAARATGRSGGSMRAAATKAAARVAPTKAAPKKSATTAATKKSATTAATKKAATKTSATKKAATKTSATKTSPTKKAAARATPPPVAGTPPGSAR